MSHLTLTGVSADGASLLLVDDQGAEFSVDITPRLRSAIRGDASRPGQLETQMDSTLRPRDIQARIRAGESPDVVAQAARTSVEKIMAFVAPVLAERQHVADRAHRSNVRRPAGDPGSSRTLGDAVDARLRADNIDPAGVDWDAWRREDGRWTLAASFALAARSGTAHFTYDIPGNYVVLDDDDARWLVGDAVEGRIDALADQQRDDLQSVRQRRLSALHGDKRPDDELPLGDDAIELVADEDDVDTVDEGDAGHAADEMPAVDMPLEAFLDESPSSDDPAAREEAADAAAEEHDPEPQRRPVQKKKGRASVPTWDEIMFGSEQ